MPLASISAFVWGMAEPPNAHCGRDDGRARADEKFSQRPEIDIKFD